MSTLDVTGTLRRLGWPRSIPWVTAVRAFQASTGLVVDGIVGPITSERLRVASSRLARGLPTLSAHFSFREFLCGCGGRYGPQGCAGILVVPALLAGLEDLRVNVIRGPLVLAGAYRCPEHNAVTPGAAPNSQHKWGAAADLTPTLTLNTVRDRRYFSGIGITGDGLVRHADVRHASGHSPPPPARGSLDIPAIWTYT